MNRSPFRSSAIAALALLFAACTTTGPGATGTPSATTAAPATATATAAATGTATTAPTTAPTEAPTTAPTEAPTTAPTSAPPQEAVELRMMLEQQENPAGLNALREHLKADFEPKNPGITVKVEAQPLEAMRTTLTTTLRGGQGPDVFIWGSGPAYAGALFKAGLLYDLTQAYQERQWPIYEFAKQSVTFDGKVVGIPGEMETIGIYYNKKIFADNGIAEPTNLAELEAAAAKIKEAGSIPFAVGNKDAWPGSHLLSMTLSSRIGSKGMKDLVAGTTSWNSPDVVAALSVWDRFNDAGFLNPSPNGVDYDGAAALFYSGEAAMFPTGSWLVPEIVDNVGQDFEVGYIPFPTESGRGIFTGGLGSGPFVAAGTKHPEEAIKLLDYLASPEHGRWSVEKLGVIPPFPVDTSGLEVSPLFAQVLADTAKFSGPDADFGSNIDVLMSEGFNDVMFKGIQAIFSKQKTAEQVAQEMDAAAKG